MVMVVELIMVLKEIGMAVVVAVVFLALLLGFVVTAQVEMVHKVLLLLPIILPPQNLPCRRLLLAVQTLYVQEYNYNLL